MMPTGGGMLYTDFAVRMLTMMAKADDLTCVKLRRVSRSIQQLHRQQHIGFVGFHDAAIHQHLVQHEVCLHNTIESHHTGAPKAKWHLVQ